MTAWFGRSELAQASIAVWMPEGAICLILCRIYSGFAFRPIIKKKIYVYNAIVLNYFYQFQVYICPLKSVAFDFCVNDFLLFYYISSKKKGQIVNVDFVLLFMFSSLPWSPFWRVFLIWFLMFQIIFVSLMAATYIQFQSCFTCYSHYFKRRWSVLLLRNYSNIFECACVGVYVVGVCAVCQ